MLKDDEPYTLGPAPDSRDPSPPPEAEEPQSPLVALTPYQTMIFAAMWIPCLFSFVAGGFAGAVIMDSAFGWLAFLALLWFTAKLGAWGWEFLTSRAYWAGFASGLAGFLFIPIYLAAGLTILGWLAETSKEASLPEPIEAGVARAGLSDELTFVQTRFNQGALPTFPKPARTVDQQQRWQECFDELYVGAGDTSEFERALRRATYRTRGLFESDPHALVVNALTKVCLKHSGVGVDQLQPYFQKAVSNALKTEAKRRPAACSTPLPDRGHQPGLDDSLDLQAVICELTEDERNVLALDLAEYTGAEIGDELGISETAARKRVERARRSLRAAWYRRAKGG